jgi:O-antigen ligase
MIIVRRITELTPAWAFGVILSVIPGLMICFPHDWKIVLAALLALLAVACAVTHRFRGRVGRFWGGGLALTLLPMLASANAAGLPASAGIPALMVAMALIGAAILSDTTNMQRTLMIAACCLAIGLVLLTLYVIATGDITTMIRMRLHSGAISVRLLPLHPNYIGSIALAMAMAALAIPRTILRRGLLLFGFLLCVVLTSRMMMMCIIILICVDFWRDIAKAWKWLWRSPVVGLGLLLLAIPICWLFLENAMLINHSGRGWNSNLSGRLTLWSASLDIWREHPWLGAGLRTTGPGPDNSYLYIASEMGAVGLAGWLGLLVLVLRQAYREPDRSMGLMMLTLTLVFMLAGITENRGLNAGNPLSILMICLFFGFLAHRDERH